MTLVRKLKHKYHERQISKIPRIDALPLDLENGRRVKEKLILLLFHWFLLYLNFLESELINECRLTLISYSRKVKKKQSVTSIYYRAFIHQRNKNARKAQVLNTIPKQRNSRTLFHKGIFSPIKALISIRNSTHYLF